MSVPILRLVYAGSSLAEWKVAQELSVQLGPTGLVVSDTTKMSRHLLRLTNDEFVYRKLRLTCIVEARPSNSTNFHIHHFRSINVAEVAFDGNVVDKGIATHLSVNPVEDSSSSIESVPIKIVAEFLGLHATLFVGCSKHGNIAYAGDGAPQFTIVRIEVEVYDATADLSKTEDNKRIVLVDVGAQGGLQEKWALKAGDITPILFEPIASEAEKLRQTIGRIPGAKVIESALAHSSGVRTLNITRDSQCSSFLLPNEDVFRRYFANIFEVIERRPIQCVRYDELFRQGIVPAPDVIKIDVQGFEYQVLCGFGHLLESAIGIELEAHFYPLYVDEKLLGEIVDFLDGYNFVLRDLQRWDWRGDFVEVNAFFTKRREDIRAYDEIKKQKFQLLSEVWRLKSRMFN
jgi:FkbM family methyltransferase